MKGLTFERLFWPTTRICAFTIVLLVVFQFANVAPESRATALCFIPVVWLAWIPFLAAHRDARRAPA